MQHRLAPHIKCFSTERGTVDVTNPYSGFNANPFYGDTSEHVDQCQQELCDSLGITSEKLIIPRQVHGTKVLDIKEENADLQSLEGIDALISKERGICLCVSTADCVPVFFHDIFHDAIGIAHAGWRGTVQQIVARTLDEMHHAFHTRATDINCVIGPSIGPEAFEVGDEVYEAFADADFPMERIAFQRPSSSRPGRQQWHIDLWEANSWLLTEYGIPPANIHICGVCTHTHHQRFFSARRLGINSGRITNGIMIKFKQ